jgi:hypothetical protein
MEQVSEMSHPLTNSFAHLRRVNGHVKAQVGAPSAAGWLRPADYFVTSRLETLRRRVEAQYDTRSKTTVAGQILRSYQWGILATGLALFLGERRAPDLTPDNLWLHWNEEYDFVDAVAYENGRFACLAADPAADFAAAVFFSLDSLRHHLRRQIETHFGEAIGRLGQHMAVPERSLWPVVADRCVATLLWLNRSLDDGDRWACDVEKEAAALVDAPDSPLYNKITGILSLEIRPGEMVLRPKRATCCGAYRQEAYDYCAACPHLPREEQLERIRAEAT